MSLDFDGINDYVDIPDNTTLDIATGNFSILSWVKSASSVSGYNTIVEKGYHLALYNASTGIYFWCGYDNQFIGNVNLIDNKWHHIALSNSVHTTTIYVDGVYYGVTTTASTQRTQNLEIGRWIGGNHYFQGLMSEVRLFNRALSVAEIKSNMYRSIVAETGLKGYWRLDEGKLNAGPGGKTAVDLSGNGNHGDDNGTMTDSDYVPAPPITVLMK